MRLFLSLFLLGSLALPALAASKANTVDLRVGEVVYARFEPSGKKIRLANAGKEPDEAAQVIFTLTRDKDTLELKLRVENKFAQDFDAQVVVHSKRISSSLPAEAISVVGGKLAFETYPALGDELTFSGFKLEW